MIRLVAFDSSFIEQSILWHRDPAIADAIGLWRGPYTEKYLRTMAVKWATDPAVRIHGLEKDGSKIGYCMLKNVDMYSGSAECHITIGDKTAHKCGRNAYRAYRLMLEDAFNEYGLRKVQTCVVSDRPDLIMWMDRGLFGFKREGFLKESVRKGDTYLDVILYGLFKSDFSKGELTCQQQSL